MESEKERAIPADLCECDDPGCPACKGKCREVAVVCMRRVDMADETGVLFCEGCSEDAADAGVFGEAEEWPPVPAQRKGV